MSGQKCESQLYVPDAAAAVGVSQVQPLKELERKTSAKEALSPHFSRDLPVRHTPKKLWEVRGSLPICIKYLFIRHVCVENTYREGKQQVCFLLFACM